MKTTKQILIYILLIMYIFPLATAQTTIINDFTTGGKLDVSLKEEVWIKYDKRLKIIDTDITPLPKLTKQLTKDDYTYYSFVAQSTGEVIIGTYNEDETLKISVRDPEEVEYRRKAKSEIERMDEELKLCQNNLENSTKEIIDIKGKLYNANTELKQAEDDIKANYSRIIENTKIQESSDNIKQASYDGGYKGAQDAYAHNLPFVVKHLTSIVLIILGASGLVLIRRYRSVKEIAIG